MRIDTATKWYGGAALAAVVVLLAGWFLLVSPQQASAADISAQADQSVSDNAALQAKINGLKAQYKDLPTLQKQLAGIQAHMPQTPELPALLRSLSVTAKASGVTLISVVAVSLKKLGTNGGKAGTPTATAGQVNAIPLTITVSGNFANVKLFLASLESLPRSLSVSGLTIARSTGSGPTATATSALTATVTARVFSANPGLTATTTTAVQSASGS